LLAASINPIDWKTRKGDVPRFAVTRPKVGTSSSSSSSSSGVSQQCFVWFQLQSHP
jgi:hypothetical protein